MRGLLGLERLMGIPSPEDDKFKPPQISSPPTSRELAVAEGLSKRGAVMYGTFEDPKCDQQRQVFGSEAWLKVPYVECDWRAPMSNPDKCNEVNVKANSLPEWIFKDGRLGGEVLSIERFEKLLQLSF